MADAQDLLKSDTEVETWPRGRERWEAEASERLVAPRVLSLNSIPPCTRHLELFCGVSQEAGCLPCAQEHPAALTTPADVNSHRDVWAARASCSWTGHELLRSTRTPDAQEKEAEQMAYLSGTPAKPFGLFMQLLALLNQHKSAPDLIFCLS